MWVKVLRKPLLLILNDYISFAPNGVMMKQKTMSRQKEVYINKNDLNILLDTMPKKVSKEISLAVDSTKKWLNK